MARGMAYLRVGSEGEGSPANKPGAFVSREKPQVTAM